VLDVLVQSKRDRRAAQKLMRVGSASEPGLGLRLSLGPLARLCAAT
jgi:hypothetical protein